MEAGSSKKSYEIRTASGIGINLGVKPKVKARQPNLNNLKTSIEKWAQSRGLQSSLHPKHTLARIGSANFDKTNTKRTLRRRSRSTSDVKKPLPNNNNNKLLRKRNEINLAPKTLQSTVAKINIPNIIPSSSNNINKNNIGKSVSTAISSNISTTGKSFQDFKKSFYLLLGQHKLLVDDYEKTKASLSLLENLPIQLKATRSDLIKLKDETEILKIEKDKLEEQNQLQDVKINILQKTLQSTDAQLILQNNIYNKFVEDYNCLTDDVSELRSLYETLTTDVMKLTSILDDYKEKLFDSDLERKKLHNEIIDLKGNLRVFCRVRPQLTTETGRKLCSWTYMGAQSLELCNRGLVTQPKFVRHKFCFDHIFHPNSSQSEIFDKVSPLVQSALDGYNVCVFTYGQTGTGKTYTLVGDSDNEGIIPRTIDFLFESIQNYKRAGWKFEIRVSFVGICNKFLYDFLDNNNKQELDTKIKICDFNITETIVSTVSRFRDLLELSYKKRATTVSVECDKLSQPHFIARIQLIGSHEKNNKTSTGIINLVDFFCSAEPKTITIETKKINRSFNELTNIILGISQKENNNINTNSKLAQLLSPCLVDNSKILLIVNLSPLLDCYEETIKSLRFAENIISSKLTKKKNNKILKTF